MIDFEQFLGDEIEKWSGGVTDTIAGGVKYVLSSGGKRVRPNCFLSAYSAFSAPCEAAYYFALGIECYHNFTLVHDDLPCMDDDDYRRGKPSCHKVYGEGQAVLIGDALQNLAYTYILKAIALAADKNRAITAAEKFNTLVGGEGLIGGQSVDIDEKTVWNEKTLGFVYKHKTCDLFEAAIACGAIMSGADDKSVDALSRFAYYYGCVFQLTDDILDKDKKEKNSFLSINSESDAESVLLDLTEKATTVLKSLDNKIDFFNDLLKKTVKRTK